MTRDYYKDFNHRSTKNRVNNASNRYQGKTKTVLTVCSAGILRSPTMAHILSSPPFNFNTRAAGVDTEYALVPVDHTLLIWADEVVCAEPWQADLVVKLWNDYRAHTRYNPYDKEEIRRIICLDIPDEYEYRSPELCKAIIDSLLINALDYFDGVRTEEINYLNYSAK